MTILSPSNLETDDYLQTGWHALHNKNIDLLNRLLLKIQALADVDTTSMPDGGILTWNATAGKWEVVSYG